MRPPSNPGQQSGEQKKSVFDRLGRQLDTGRPVERGSPARYGENLMHPGMHEPPPPDFGGGGRYMRGEGPPDIDWRYARRQQLPQHMPYGRPDRHPSQVGPLPMPQYDMDVLGPGREPPHYYQHPHMPPFPPVPPGAMLPMLGGPDPIAMGMHQQRRPSPKYDRHGNPIRGGLMRMDHPHGMSPPGGFGGPPMPGPMLPPGAHDMLPMRPGMYPHERWDNSMGPMGLQLPDPRLLPNGRFLEQANNQRFQQQQQGPMMMNPDIMLGPQPIFEAPRYSKWRERRDVITNLDRQTAQSSSKTNSLKSSLQQPDNKGNMSRRSREQKTNDQSSIRQSQEAIKKSAETSADKSEVKKSPKKKKKPVEKKDPQDISDGEIIDDEDTSDESDSQKETPDKSQSERDNLMMQNRVGRPAYMRKQLDIQYHEKGKRRRLQDRDEHSMDYETISDDELDDFMSDEKLGEDKEGEGMKGKNQSEIELLNALGLDWATLIEMSKQSRKETQTSDSALRRFSIPKYLPTLGISKELAGPEIYNLIIKITS